MSRFYCTRSLIMWCVFFGLVVAVLLRYGLLPQVDPEASYLAGIYDRGQSSLFYQVMVVVFLGCAGYGATLLAVLSCWLSKSFGAVKVLASLVGLRLVELEQREILDSNRLGMQLAATPIRDAAVIFPAIGFIGTVIGVSMAIGGLNAVVESGETATLLEGLRVAFDTTFIGLVASVILSSLLYLIQSRLTLLEL